MCLCQPQTTLVTWLLMSRLDGRTKWSWLSRNFKHHSFPKTDLNPVPDRVEGEPPDDDDYQPGLVSACTVPLFVCDSGVGWEKHQSQAHFKGRGLWQGTLLSQTNDEGTWSTAGAELQAACVGVYMCACMAHPFIQVIRASIERGSCRFYCWNPARAHHPGCPYNRVSDV